VSADNDAPPFKRTPPPAWSVQRRYISDDSTLVLSDLCDTSTGWHSFHKNVDVRKTTQSCLQTEKMDLQSGNGKTAIPFNQLPKEIRLLVWEATFEPQYIPLRFVEGRRLRSNIPVYAFKPYDDPKSPTALQVCHESRTLALQRYRPWNFRWYLHDRVERSKVVRVLSVSSSWEFGILQLLNIWFGSFPSLPRMTFENVMSLLLSICGTLCRSRYSEILTLGVQVMWDPVYDIVVLPKKFYKYQLEALKVSCHFQLKVLRNLALPGCFWLMEQSGRISPGPLPTLSKAFPNLEQLIICLGGEAERSAWDRPNLDSQSIFPHNPDTRVSTNIDDGLSHIRTETPEWPLSIIKVWEAEDDADMLYGELLRVMIGEDKQPVYKCWCKPSRWDTSIHDAHGLKG